MLMLAFLFLFSALQSSTFSTPLGTAIPIQDSRFPDPGSLVLRSQDQPDRTLWGIILSCFTTIFACTWVAVHPNLPGPRDSGFLKLARKVVTMLGALVAPELVTLWALRQRIAAREIAKGMNEMIGREHPEADGEGSSLLRDWFLGPSSAPSEEWTTTHGFLLQMGGFLLYEGKTPVAVLTFESLKRLIQKGQVEIPEVTEEEINDKSKGDLLTKLVAVVQTTWFGVHCIGRWASRLTVTELEVMTLAFVVLNVITYALWWQKPQNVCVAIRVKLKVSYIEVAGELAQRRVPKARESKWTPRRRKGGKIGWCGWICMAPVLVIISPVLFVQCMVGLLAMLIGREGNDVDPKSLRVPTFHADREWQSDLLPFVLFSTLLGGIHLIPWSSSFPSHDELKWWRYASLYITLSPFIMTMSLKAVPWADKHLPKWLSATLYVVLGQAILGIPLYIVARIVLFVLAFTTLRALPPAVYMDVKWTSLIPHI